MICSSCGFEIKGKRHGPYDGRYVCDNCWNNPALFFPDKMTQTIENIAQMISKMTSINSTRWK